MSRNAGERVTYASSIYPHERGHGILTPRFRFYPSYSSYSREWSLLTTLLKSLHPSVYHPNNANVSTSTVGPCHSVMVSGTAATSPRARSEIETNILRGFRSYGDNN